MGWMKGECDKFLDDKMHYCYKLGLFVAEIELLMNSSTDSSSGPTNNLET